MVRQDNTTPHESSQYDDKVRQTIPFYETMHQETVDLVQTVRPDVACWLDTGCGTGYLVELALPVFPQTRFILADPAQAMLERWGRFQVRAGRSPAVVESHVQRFGSGYFPITVDEHLRLLTETGFRIVELCWFSHMQAGFYGIK